MILTITDWAGDQVSLEPKVELCSVRDFMGKKLPGLAIVLNEGAAHRMRQKNMPCSRCPSGISSA